MNPCVLRGYSLAAAMQLSRRALIVYRFVEGWLDVTAAQGCRLDARGDYKALCPQKCMGSVFNILI